MGFDKGLTDGGVLAKSCWYLLKGIMFIAGSFVFSVIFWKTKKWLDKKPGKKKK